MHPEKVVVIGAGVIGLTHAVTARELGCEVVVLERDGRALGASVRNSGTLWPIGWGYGEEREGALFGVKKWKEIATAAGIWHRPCGSLSLAFREEAWAVLNEFCQGRDGFELLDAAAARRFPAANPSGPRGALFSPEETVMRGRKGVKTLFLVLRVGAVQMEAQVPRACLHPIPISKGRAPVDAGANGLELRGGQRLVDPLGPAR
jgi:glycine/D-amino acid oxidase-like deaminating enzyme